MLTVVNAINSQGGNLMLPLGPSTNGIYIKEIEGLDPVKANIVSSSFASVDGSQYQSSRRDARNIVIKLGLELGVLPVKELRKRLYGFFMPKSEVKLSFYTTDMPLVEIKGRVESFESPLFVKDPEVSISIICGNPDFMPPSETVLSLTTSSNGETEVEYDGTIETGIKFYMIADRSVPNFSIIHTAPDSTVYTLDFMFPLTTGDSIHINTNPGSKGATLTRSNSQTSVLYGITPFSNWINLYPGSNWLSIYSEGTPISCSVSYVEKYGGL